MSQMLPVFTMDPDPTEKLAAAPLTPEQALVDYDEAAHGERMALRFPTGPIPYRPCGEWVLLQDRSPRKKVGSILITQTQQDIDSMGEHIAKVVLVGQTAGWDKLNGEVLPGWPHFQPGHFVVVPRYSSNRHGDKGENKPMYRLANYREILGVVTLIERVLD